MKKLLAAALCLLGLCACGRTPPERPAAGQTLAPPTARAGAGEPGEAYGPILEELARLEQTLGQGGDFDPDEWEALGLVEPVGELGYAFRDINGDETPELFLLSREGGGAAIRSLFTLKDGNPVLLGQYWSRSRAALAADGTIYTVGSGSAWAAYLNSYKLEPGAGELTHLTEYYTDIEDMDDESSQYWVQVAHAGELIISEEKFDGLFSKYEAPENPAALEFIPVP